MIKDTLNKFRKNKAVMAVLYLLLLLIFYKGYIWSQTQSTDNAYVEADISLVSGEINGRVTSLLVKDNAKVTKGDVIAEIDDTDYLAEFKKACSDLDVAQNTVKITEQKIEIQKLDIEKFGDNLNFAKVSFDIADRNYNRTSKLAADNFSSKKILDDAKNDFEKAKFNLLDAQFELDSGHKNLELLELQKLSDDEQVNIIEQTKAIAEHAMNNTKIRAPVDGVIANNNIKIGNYIKQGVPLVAVVPTEGLYIKANFKETQVAKLSPGTKVRIEFDAAPGVKVKGHIRAIYPATGSKFSLIPPDNATGNFTKVVQRVPVIIDFGLPEEARGKIKAGMSAIVYVRR